MNLGTKKSHCWDWNGNVESQYWQKNGTKETLFWIKLGTKKSLCLFWKENFFLHAFGLSAHIVKIFIFLSDSIYCPMNICEKKFDLDKMQSLPEVSKTFKFAAILVHHSHQSSLVWNELWGRLRNTWLQAWLTLLVLPLLINLVVHVKCWKRTFYKDYEATFTEAKQAR